MSTAGPSQGARTEAAGEGLSVSTAGPSVASLAVEPARILVVDDTEANRDLLVRRLQRQGHRTDTAVDGRQALERLRAAAFDLVLLDIMMPVLNGYEVLQQMRADPGLQHVPVVMISALGDSENIVKGIELGADDYLPKPFNPHILRARVASCLAKKRLHDREQMHARSLQRELDIARRIQAGFLPETLPQPAGWALAAWFQPARQVSGDFYDAFPVLESSRMVLVVADVCDKGVGAALFMALFRSLLRVLAERVFQHAGDEAAQVRELVVGVNDYIARTHGRDNMFATMFVALLDPASGAMAYVNGGHEEPMRVGPQGVCERLAPTGPAVGLLPGLPFQAGRTVLAPGESLVVFTDGVTDAIGPGGERHSEAPLQAALFAQPLDSAQQAVARIRDALQARSCGEETFDDITLLVVHRQLAA